MKILFVCKYNRFRSKTAEAFFKKINKNPKHEVQGAGVIRGDYPLDVTESAVAREFGIDLRGKPQGLSQKIFGWADLVILVADDVPPNIFDRDAKKLMVWKVSDNWDGDKKKLRKIVAEIEKRVSKFVKGVEK